MDVPFQNLDSDIQSLYELCAEWGLSQEEIDRGISGVFGSRTEHAPSGKKSDVVPVAGRPDAQSTQTEVSTGPLRKTRRCLWKAFKVSLVVWFVFVVLYNMVNFFPPAERLANKLLSPLNYPIVRTVRLLTLPFAHSLQFSGFYTMECLVDNPWFVQPSIDCQECQHVTRIKSFKHIKNFDEEYYNRGQPVLVKDAMQFNVTLEDLQEVCQQNDNADNLKNGILQFKTNSEQVTSVGALLNPTTFAELKEQKQQLHVEWSGRGVAAARVLRQLFPRPYFVPKASEVSLEKTVLVDGPESKTYTLPKGSYSNTWYVQGSGSRHLVLHPKADCSSKCKPLDVIVRAGQIVNFNDMVWRVDSMPNNEPGEAPEMSISFCGTYY